MSSGFFMLQPQSGEIPVPAARAAGSERETA
jgi:hypothetical protein